MTASIFDLLQYRTGKQIMAETPETNKPDFRNGFPIRDLGGGSMISGQADGEELVLARRGDEVFAIGPLHPLRWPAHRRWSGCHFCSFYLSFHPKRGCCGAHDSSSKAAAQEN